MAIFRSYLAAQASLIRNNGTNSSRNPIIELSYGGSADSVESTKVSRFLFQPSLDELRAEVAAGRLRRDEVTKHELFFKNVVALVPDLVNEEVEEAKRGNGVTVLLRLLPAAEPFSEGKGYDYLYYPGRQLQERAAQQAPNWFFRQNGTPWATPGAYNPLTAPTIGRCQVNEGTEDLRFDITDYVQGVLFDGAPEQALLLQLDEQTESVLDVRRYVITFFSRHTHHWFEPHLQTVYEPVLYEQRCELPLDEPTRLFLQVPANLLDVAVLNVNVRDETGQVLAVYAGESVKQSRAGVYYLDLTLDSALTQDGARLCDEWVLLQGTQLKKIAQYFTVTDRLLAPMRDGFERLYVLSASGLRHNEVISRSQAAKVRRVVVNFRKIENGQVQAACCPPEQVVYRVYCPQGKEQLEVVPYTPCYQVGGATFFELDARWMVPQYYVLEVIALTADGQQQGTPLQLKFRVVN
jgi:hypothetical protein